jgi:hypothetical protein
MLTRAAVKPCYSDVQDSQVAITRVANSEMDNSENVAAFDGYAKLNNIIERTYHCVVDKKKMKKLSPPSQPTLPTLIHRQSGRFFLPCPSMTPMTASATSTSTPTLTTTTKPLVLEKTAFGWRVKVHGISTPLIWRLVPTPVTLQPRTLHLALIVQTAHRHSQTLSLHPIAPPSPQPLPAPRGGQRRSWRRRFRRSSKQPHRKSSG